MGGMLIGYLFKSKMQMKKRFIKNSNFSGFTPTPCRFGSDKFDRLAGEACLFSEHKKNNKVWGFTLVELAVSMLIIGIISTIVLANYNTGRKQEALNRSAQRLAVAIRQAQNYALFSRVGTKCSTPPGGYGIYIASDSQYIIFGDCGNGVVGGPADHVYESSTDDLISTINVEPTVVIPSSQSPSVIGASLTFEPPIGKFYYKSLVPAVSNTIRIVLQNSSDATKQKTITISANGSVSVR